MDRKKLRGLWRTARHQTSEAKRCEGQQQKTGDINPTSKTDGREMASHEALTAELEAIALWDRLFADNPKPDVIDKDACATRLFRRLQIVIELEHLDREPGNRGNPTAEVTCPSTAD